MAGEQQERPADHEPADTDDREEPGQTPSSPDDDIDRDIDFQEREKRKREED